MEGEHSMKLDQCCHANYLHVQKVGESVCTFFATCRLNMIMGAKESVKGKCAQTHLQSHSCNYVHYIVWIDSVPCLHTWDTVCWWTVHFQVAFEEIAKLLDPEKRVKTVQNFTDIYFHLPGLPNNGNGTESNWIRVRNCEGRFALLIREVYIL